MNMNLNLNLNLKPSNNQQLLAALMATLKS